MFKQFLCFGWSLFTNVDSEFINVEFQDFLGLQEAIAWCDGSQNGVIKVVNRLMSSSLLQTKQVQAFADRFVREFDRNGNLIRLPEEWATATCVKNATFSDLEETDDFCQMEDEYSTETFVNKQERLQTLSKTLTYHQAQLLKDILQRWLPQEVTDELNPMEWKQEALLSLAHLLRTSFAFFKFQAPLFLRGKISALAGRLCRLQDIEASTAGLRESMPLTCTVADTIAVISTCQTALWQPRKLPCRHAATISDFPATECFSPASILQRTGAYGNQRLRAFNWDDELLRVDLVLSKVQPLPPLIDPSTRNAELFTYLTLYRSLALLYRMVEIPYYYCNSTKAQSVIPGWETIQVITATHPHEPSFASHPTFNRLPHVLISQFGCKFAVGVRGTVLRSEWFTNFLLRESPMSLWNRSDAGAAFGYLSVVHRLLPIVVAALEKHSRERKCSIDNSKIIMYGHSLGSAIAQIMSVYLADRYSAMGTIVEGVFYAGPRALNLAGTEAYATTVNGRYLIDLADPLFYLPCHAGNSRSGMTRCGKDHFVPYGEGRDYWVSPPGIVLVDTNIPASKMTGALGALDSSPTEMLESIANDTVILDGAGGNTFLDVLLSPTSGFPVIYEILSRALTQFLAPLRNLQAIPSRAELIAAHVASLACALSTACHGLPWSEFRWWCHKLD
eukprot:Gregarina_sp_Poly_1__241@NODE_1056_length_5213_cov_138_229887_g734_i0_p1_GENE_NODE_1056_length_5213_cov_138_229887_g734_i0NODE_1056_length_5213_cov_138_229887_g734_i0_p1_ORF_typecomplete_len676_score64_08Lipase_3/PF01764_25/1_4e12DUF818/PF05677_12/0_00044Esterase_phd/PF10503_9/0_0023DUF2974/PF11187_8/0_01BAAT_C/PF08840_11/0_015DUF676/PF05057_14/0_068Abhydrolase_3/PF07859_13/0_078Hydrolase_4/PF12146_8/0_074Abhydrolase_6/PF12697_7/5_7e03Abhydrolase_6/PF12697_7/0_12Lipase/PF00151_19/7_7e02Lipase/PF